MNNDEVNALRGIIEQRSEIRAGDEFGDAVAVKLHSSERCKADSRRECIFISPGVRCPTRRVEARVVMACATGSPHVKRELVFVPKLEYLTWKLTQS